MHKHLVLIGLAIPLLSGCAIFTTAKYRFSDPKTDEPLVNMPLAACAGPHPPTYPFYLDTFECVTDSYGIATIKRFPNGKNTWIRVDTFKIMKRKECEDLLDHFYFSDLEIGQTLEKTNFSVERLPVK